MAVYGNQLAFFPELFTGFKNYSLEPEIVSGRKERKLIKSFRGIFQFLKTSELDREGNTLNPITQPTLWTKTKLQKGTYIVPDDSPDELYVVNKVNSYNREGDFTVYILETAVASSDTHKENEDFNYGAGGFE